MASSLGQYSSRSASVASRAVSVEDLVLGLERHLRVGDRFRYHIGLVARPPCEATSTMRWPSCRNSSGLSRGSPDLRPIVVRIPTSVPLQELVAELAVGLLEDEGLRLRHPLDRGADLGRVQAFDLLGLERAGRVGHVGGPYRVEERPDAGPDVVDLAVGGRDEEGLVDVRAHPAPGQRRLGHQVEPGPHLVADDGELRASSPTSMTRYCGPPIEAAAQVVSRESGLEADLDAGAVRRERHASARWLTSASM